MIAERKGARMHLSSAKGKVRFVSGLAVEVVRLSRECSPDKKSYLSVPMSVSLRLSSVPASYRS
jgi:hypothetical protein